MPDKVLQIVSGRPTEVEATVVSGGVGNAGDIVALDGTGKLDNSVLPPGIGADTATIVASEALSAGDFVNIWDDAGTPKARKADATTTGKEANGFVLAAVLQDANAEVFFEGSNNQRAGLTGGMDYYLSTSAGGVTTTAPSGSGNVVQIIGRSVSATTISFEPHLVCVRA